MNNVIIKIYLGGQYVSRCIWLQYAYILLQRNHNGCLRTWRGNFLLEEKQIILFNKKIEPRLWNDGVQFFDIS